MNSNVGYIYILTNQSFHRSNWVKIGYTTNVDRRVKELSNTSVPMPFEVYATYEIPASAGIADKAVHSIIQRLNPSLRLTPNREFFEIEPWDAYNILESMAIIHGRTDKLYRNKANHYFQDPETNVSKDEYSVEALFPNNTVVRIVYDKFVALLNNTIPKLTVVPNKNYVAFKKNKRNVVSVWPKENSIEVVLSAKLNTIKDDNDIIYDISNRLWTAAQYALRYDDTLDNDVVADLLLQTYKNI